jgi:hypothetical protein
MLGANVTHPHGWARGYRAPRPAVNRIRGATRRRTRTGRSARGTVRIVDVFGPGVLILRPRHAAPAFRTNDARARRLALRALMCPSIDSRTTPLALTRDGGVTHCRRSGRRMGLSRIGIAACLACVVFGCAEAGAAIAFTDVTETALPGVASAPGLAAVDPRYSGGAAVGDCDGDGLPDVYFTGAGHDVLYRNRGDGTFEDVTVAAGLGASVGTRGAAFGDVDGDGDLDLYATGFADARHFLYVNDGTCRFTEEAAARGVAVGTRAIGRSVSFGDYDRDGWLDLFVTEIQSDALNPGVPGPIGHLFRNRGAAEPGVFDDTTAAAGVALDAVPGPQAGTFAFAARFTDLDGDGWPDLAVASDYGESRVFWNDRAGAFVDTTGASGVGGDEHGMGLTSADLDGDGRFDLFVTSIFVDGVANATGNRLYRNEGNRTFTDVTDAADVRDASWGWGTQAFDMDGDGDLDLIATNGASDAAAWRPFVQADLPGIDLVPFATDPLRLWENDGHARFSEVSAAAGIADTGVGQGVVAFDYDGDGDRDVLLTHDGSPPTLRRNDATAAHWLGIELEGVRSQRNGIGAVVTVVPRRGARPLTQEMSASSTHLAQDGTGRLHFGLGAAAGRVRAVTIRWPSGRVQTVKRLAADAVHRVTETTSCRGRAGKTDLNCVRDKAERECIVGLNDAGAKVAVATVKRFTGCVGARRGGGSAEACVAGDPGGRIGAARARVDAVAAARCAEPPRFGPLSGPLSAADVCDGSEGVLRPHDVFGPDLDTVLLDPAQDRAGAACQATVARGLAKLAIAQLAAFNRCKRRGLERGEITTAAQLAACHTATVAPRIDALVARLGRQAGKRCGGVALATAFPGKCADVAPGALLACLREQSSCGVCLALNRADGLGRGCHRFTDGVATTYCGDRPARTGSIAREWDEALLAAIRIDTPRPTVHARNLFHLSALMWDVWRAYGGGGTAWLTDESHASDDPARDREIAISFAAYRLLAERFAKGPGQAKTQAALRAKMYELGLDTEYTGADGDGPAAVGNRLAAATIAFGLGDGANEAGNYADPSYVPANQPLIVKQPGTVMADPNRWQPLALDLIVSQNGIPLPGNIQTAIGTRWKQVVPFALTRSDPTDVYVDPGPHPRLGDPVGDAGYKEGARRVIELSGRLDPADGVLVDISPGVFGNNPLGTNDGTGHPVNPHTGQPYASNVVPRADFLRVLAEFWADGPQSETPPGHWNVLANEVSDALPAYHVGGTGPALDRLEWDVKLYLALNGAVHDAAIVAWGLKGKYDSVRPISMIRYLGGKGQSTDALGPSYAPDGLPLEPGLIEVITPETSAGGQRHSHLAGHEGEIAIHAYAGTPASATDNPAGVRWIRAIEWVPYQKRTFVTPAFPGYASGHSTFSRAAAEVMTLFTGDAYFPGGLGIHHATANTSLTFERGPSVDVDLQWGTYYDAADQAGLSRIAGGIHVPADDFTGRATGSVVGIDAFAKAMQYFAAP